MKLILTPAAIAAISVLSIALAVAQTGTGSTQHYEQRGLAFDYPAGWTLTENGKLGAQSVAIAAAGAETQIVLSVERTLNRSCDFQAEATNIRATLAERVAAQIQATSPVRTSVIRTEVATIDAEGTQIKGVIDNKPVTAEVYSLRLNSQFVSLIYVRNDADQSAQPAWELVRRTMKLDRSVMTYGVAAAGGSSSTTTRQPGSASSGVLNGRALVLPKPAYPPAARSAHVAGVVAVQVVIDETGKVISAHAVFGHPLLQAVSVDAARGAKFSPPKFCGEALRVTGVIAYNFVAL